MKKADTNQYMHEQVETLRRVTFQRYVEDTANGDLFAMAGRYLNIHPKYEVESVNLSVADVNGYLYEYLTLFIRERS